MDGFAGTALDHETHQGWAPQADVAITRSAPDDERRRFEEQLVLEHLPLVGYIVTETLTRLPAHVRREDLTSAALLGLAVAARAFEPERGVPFASFARVRIRGSVVDELRASDWASRSVRSKARARDHAIETLTVTLGRPPTPAELADTLGISVESLGTDEADLHRALVLSLSATTSEDGDEISIAPAEPRTPELELLDRERTGYLHDAIACLPDRLRSVVVGYYFEERPMAQLAAELGVTESRISQMRAEAVGLMRVVLEAHLESGGLPAAPDDGLAGTARRRLESYVSAVGSRSTYRARISMRPVTPAVRPAITIPQQRLAESG